MDYDPQSDIGWKYLADGYDAADGGSKPAPYLHNFGHDRNIRSAMKPCRHTLQTHTFSAPQVRVLSSVSGSTNVYIRSLSSADIASLKTHAVSTLPSINLGVLAREGWSKIKPKLLKGMSLINFILELKDFKHSFTKVGEAVSRLRAAGQKKFRNGRFIPPKKVSLSSPRYSDVFYRMPGGRRKMLKDIVRRLTGAHLEAEFALVPFIGDLVSACTQLNALERNLEVLKRYANVPQKRHWRIVLPNADGSASTRAWRYQSSVNRLWAEPFNTDDYPRPGISFRGRARWVQRPVYTLTVEYRYSLPKVSEVELRTAALWDTLGVKFDPGILWDAIPFSFLVDWVADVGTFLHSFARDNLPITISDMRCCHSIAYHYEAEIACGFTTKNRNQFGPQPLWWPLPDGTRVFSDTVFRTAFASYDRSLLHMGAITPEVAIGAPNGKQLLLAGSLFLSKLTGNKRRYRTH